MEAYYQDESVTLFNASCLDALPCLASESVDSVVTDPPYELGFMGKSWDRSGIAYNVEVWRECLRVLKPGGHLLAFGGSRTYHRLACAIEDAGFEIRDQIQWIYGSGFPKSLDVSKALDGVLGTQGRGFISAGDDGRVAEFKQDLDRRADYGFKYAPVTDAAKQWDGWGTALKPAHEPIVLARKPLVGTVAQNILEHGTGGLNVDGCRIDPAGEQIGAGSKSLVAWRRTEGRSDLPVQPIAERPDSLGRWPANIILDGSDEVVRLFPVNEANGYRLNPSRVDLSDAVIGYSGDAVRGERGYDDIGSAARFFYCAKASKEDREEGLDDLPIRSAGDVTDRKDGSDGLNSPRAGAGRTNGSRNHHPTVKPTDLMRYLVRLITPPSGTVLDPFAGSGSTGKACAHEGFNAILIEKELEYCELAKRRARLAQGKFRFEAIA